MENAELRIAPNADEYIAELRNLLDAYDVGPRDFSFLDKSYVCCIINLHTHLFFSSAMMSNSRTASTSCQRCTIRTPGSRESCANAAFA